MKLSYSHVARGNTLFQRAMMRASSTAAATAESPIIVEQRNKLLTLTLNRPKALNALSLEMCDSMKDLLLNRINVPDSTVGAFIVKGAGGKAFCAGGDVKSIWSDLDNLVKQGTEVDGKLIVKDLGVGKPGFLHSDFFRQEYIMNYLIGTSDTPQVSLWDGIVMGGGVGISVLGEFRVATEKSMFAMPETAIGLFPDVGSSAWLPHLPSGFGYYIGLTGVRLNGADLIHSGIATHYINSERLAELEAEIAEGVMVDPVESRKFIKSILDKHQSMSTKPESGASSLAVNEAIIKKCFGEDVESLDQAIALLEAEKTAGSEFAAKTLSQLEKMCPLSLKITFAQLMRGEQLDLHGCLKMEYRLMMGCMRSGQFKEGVRALLVDKDNNPVWTPKTLAEVSDEQVEKCFKPLGEYELNVV